MSLYRSNTANFVIHGGSMKSKPNFVFHISRPTSNMKTVFKILARKHSIVWFDYLIKEVVLNALLLLARRIRYLTRATFSSVRNGLHLSLPMTRSTDPVTLIFEAIYLIRFWSNVFW